MAYMEHNFLQVMSIRKYLTFHRMLIPFSGKIRIMIDKTMLLDQQI